MTECCFLMNIQIESPLAGGIPPPPSSEAWRLVFRASLGQHSAGAQARRRSMGESSLAGIGPRWPSKSPRTRPGNPRRPKMSSPPESPTWPPESPRRPQNGPEMASGGSKMIPKSPKMAPREPKRWERRDSGGEGEQKGQKRAVYLKVLGRFSGPKIPEHRAPVEARVRF